MKVISCIAVVTFLLGCRSAQQATCVSVGMPFQEAKTILKSAGAKQTQMDMTGATETHLIETYDLPDGTVACLHVSKETKAVDVLERCANPEAPKGRRVWESVQSLALPCSEPDTRDHRE